MYHITMKFIMVIIILFTSFTIAVKAQDLKQIILKNSHANNNLTIDAVAEDGNNYTISLWGIEFLEDNNRIATRIQMDRILGNGMINCTIKEWGNGRQALAQCVGTNDNDIALSLIQDGYAVTDQNAVQGTVFEDIYSKSERQSVEARNGLWERILPDSKSLIQQQNDDPFVLTQGLAHFMIGALIFGPFIGMLVVAFIIYGGFKRLIHLQKYQMAMAQKRDRAMREREKFIVAASLEGELNTNRAKVDAFIIIYEQMLKNLRDPLKDHKYKKNGDIIHQKPALSRNVYDSNIDKLDLLGVNLVTDITHLYTDIEPNPEYKNIEASTPVEEVIDYISTIVSEAEALLTQMETISSALNVIVRDKRANNKR